MELSARICIKKYFYNFVKCKTLSVILILNPDKNVVSASLHMWPCRNQSSIRWEVQLYFDYIIYLFIYLFESPSLLIL